MKNLLRTLAAGLLAPVITAQASTTYEDIVAAATNPQDLSRQALVTIFGDVVTNPLAGGNTTIIGNLFAVFNGIIAILAVIWFIIIGLKHINKAGHQGKAFSGDRDIVGTLSTLAGFLVIVPTSNGWSLAQLTMLWGATHLGTAQDRGSRAAYGYIYLIDMMIRPALMVFGFFFASVAIIAVGTILHALFGAALTNVQTNSVTGLFSMAGFLLIYARICTTLVSSMFALQAYLPDYVISFLGGREAANTLGNMAGSIKEIFAGASQNTRKTPGVDIKGIGNPSDKNKDGING